MEANTLTISRLMSIMPQVTTIMTLLMTLCAMTLLMTLMTLLMTGHGGPDPPAVPHDAVQPGGPGECGGRAAPPGQARG